MPSGIVLIEGSRLDGGLQGGALQYIQRGICGIVVHSRDSLKCTVGLPWHALALYGVLAPNLFRVSDLVMLAGEAPPLCPTVAFLVRKTGQLGDLCPLAGLSLLILRSNPATWKTSRHLSLRLPS